MKLGDLFERVMERIPPLGGIGAAAEGGAASADDPTPADLPVPVLWLLGKTGAGKSSLVQAMTGEDAIAVGNGFSPCTRTSSVYDHPPGAPVVRFLDTRGLAETGYDAAEDLEVSESGSHAILAVARLDDPVQHELTAALREVRRKRPKFPVLVVHTGADLVPDAGMRGRARGQVQQALEKAAGGPLPSVEVALQPGRPAPPALIDSLAGVLPEVALFLAAESASDAEGQQFLRHRALVFRYAGAAGASDVVPVAGAVSVPALQAAMLRQLARAYRVTWGRDDLRRFAAALGAGAVLQYGASFGLRQLAKLVPVYGQTLGAAAAATLSFSTTLALGRAAAYWLYHQSRGKPVDAAALREKYAEALRRASDKAG
ncbi:YcjF family protein [Halodurantibacterium flavum]|uniref:YcjF family protein n=1 Tax=Halodurantibacterium flavum TaxID=1382802 RepID=A0ABW4S5W7_9RHOB